MNKAFINGKIIELDFSNRKAVAVVQTGARVVRVNIPDYLLDENEADGIYLETGFGLFAECNVRNKSVHAQEMEIIEDGSTLTGFNIVVISGVLLEAVESKDFTELDVFTDDDQIVRLRANKRLLEGVKLEKGSEYVLHAKANTEILISAIELAPEV